MPTPKKPAPQDADSAKTYTLLGADRSFYQSNTPGTLGGYQPRKIYGRLDCPSAIRAITRGGYVRHRVFFADEAIAIAAGYRPCAFVYERNICCGKRCVRRSMIPAIPFILPPDLPI